MWYYVTQKNLPSACLPRMPQLLLQGISPHKHLWKPSEGCCVTALSSQGESALSPKAFWLVTFDLLFTLEDRSLFSWQRNKANSRSGEAASRQAGLDVQHDKRWSHTRVDTLPQSLQGGINPSDKWGFNEAEAPSWLVDWLAGRLDSLGLHAWIQSREKPALRLRAELSALHGSSTLETRWTEC